MTVWLKAYSTLWKTTMNKKKTKTKTKKNMKTLVILQQTSPTNVQFWCSFGEVQIMFQKCLKKTDSEKNMITLLHLGQSVHECIGLAMDSITLLFFIISSTQDCALVMLGSSSQLTSTLGDRETLVFAEHLCTWYHGFHRLKAPKNFL